VGQPTISSPSINFTQPTISAPTISIGNLQWHDSGTGSSGLPSRIGATGMAFRTQSDSVHVDAFAPCLTATASAPSASGGAAALASAPVATGGTVGPGASALIDMIGHLGLHFIVYVGP
jgi:hypothetical protein